MDSIQKTTAHALFQLSPSGQGPSKSFQVLVRSIGEAKTKHEEDRIIKREAVILKDRMSSRETTQRQMREYLVRMIYCEMLGVSCPWGHIHAVTFTQKSNLIDKRIGYLTCSLVLHPDHELNMLLVNSIQRDLRSSNMLEISMALIIVSRLVGAEMIPAVLPLVREKLHHPKELVRKKALLVLHHFYKCSANSIDHLKDDVRKGLSDPDPGVMEAALILLYDIIQDNPSEHKDLTPAFINILSQVVNHRLPSEFEYHGVPVPWVQMRILRILAVLGADDAKVSEEIYPLMENTLACAESNSNVGQAITYECIRTITAIYPNPAMIKKAAAAISRFLTNQNNNWKYLGITALAALVQVDPKYALDYQLMVIDCLDDPDETLKRKTLDLLYKMTNPANVKVISEKLLSYLKSSTNKFIKADLVSKITQLAERFSPDNEWFIETMNSVFEVGGEYVRREVAYNLMRLIAEGTEDEDIDTELRTNAVLSYVNLLSKPSLPDIMIKVICWVIGEYAYIAEDLDLEDVLEKLMNLLNYDFQDSRTHSWIMNSICRLVAQLGHLPEVIHTRIALYLTSVDTDVQQRSSELLEFTRNLNLMQEVLPLDSACEDLEVDSSLSFLDAHVSEALVNGAAPYKPMHLRSPSEKMNAAAPQQPGIKFEPYAEPLRPSRHRVKPDTGVLQPEKQYTADVETAETTGSFSTSLGHTITSSEVKSAVISSPSPDLSDRINVKGGRKWGKEGYNKTINTQPEQVPDRLPEEQYSVGSDSNHLSQTVPDSHGINKHENKSNTKISNVEAKPALTPEEKRKSDLASVLFTGLSKPAGNVRTKSETSVKKEKQSALPYAATRENVSEDLLLDLQGQDIISPDFNTGNSDTGQLIIEPTPRNSSSNEDLLQPSKPSRDDLIGLFDSPLETNAQYSSNNEVPLMDADLLTPVQSQEIPNKSVHSSNVLSSISGHPVISGWDKQEICRDAKISVTATKIIKPDSLAIVLTLSNCTQSQASNVSISITLPSSVKELRSEESPGLFWKGEIGAFGSFPYLLHLLPKTPSGGTLNIKGELSYLNKRMFFDLKISETDFIRPMEISESDFGQKWKSFSSEKKVKITKHSLTSTSDFMKLMSGQFNFHPVKIIGIEGICCGVFLPDTLCLVHGKVQTQSLEIWIKAQTTGLTDVLSKQFQMIG